MLVNSVVFGPIEVGNNQIYSMPEGLYGFGDVGDFALITKQDDDVTLMWFQSVESEVPCFVVFNPYEIIEGYKPVIEPSDLRAIGCKRESELEFLVIAVVPEDVTKITVNLKSPIVLNHKNNTARQVILTNKDYPIKFSLVEEQQAVNA